MKIKDQIAHDKLVSSLSSKGKVEHKKYVAVLKEFERLQRELDAQKAIKEVVTHAIKPRKGLKSEATAIVVASDWHMEEVVEGETVNNLNEYSPKIAVDRAELFFSTAVKMVGIFGKDISIKNMVLHLGGDFISGSIHDELMEGNALLPIDAIMLAQNTIASGIEYILKNTDLSLVIPCSSGNHARMTKKQRHSTESGNSLEYFMYHNLARHFAGNKRVKFLISRSYHTYVDVYGYKVRFHHGHSIKFGGGIGGVFIPAFKAISQWNKSLRADLDVFCHFHQMRDGGNFLLNGSLIGYNAYGLSIKGEFEKPKQIFCLIDRERGKTVVCPIIAD